MSQETSTLRIDSQLQALAKSVAVLNEKTDQADEALRRIEERLRTTNPGHYLCLDDSFECLGPLPRRLQDVQHRDFERFHLLWEKGEAGTWELHVILVEACEKVIDVDDESGEPTWVLEHENSHAFGPLLSQSRELKRKALAFMPKFLEGMRTHVDKALATLTNALEETQDGSR